MESPITVEPKDSNSAPLPPFPSLLRKRRKSKPTRFEIDPEKQLPLSIVASDLSNHCLSLQQENSPSLQQENIPCLQQENFPSLQQENIPSLQQENSPSLQQEKSPTKTVKTPVPSSAAMIQAMNFQSSLGSEFPFCIKTMVKSQVACGFWMGLPLHFCKNYLPAEDATFLLEVENGDQCEVKYIAYKFGLSAGWKKFVIRHHLTEGDVLIFQLVETTKFKIYIFKVSDPSEVNGALSIMNLEEPIEEMTPALVTPSPKRKKKKRVESLSLTVVKKKHKKSSLSPKSVPPSQLNYQLIEHSGNDSEEVGSEVLEDLTSCKNNISFEEIKSFEDFHIMVKGKCIDHELPDDVRAGYYKLCFCKKKFLHESIRGSLYCKLVAGMIGETVSIANEIKNCRITTTKDEFETWDKSLNSFEILGMKVGFLRERIQKLTTIVLESEGASKRYMEAVNKHKRAEDEIKKVAAKLKELKGTAKKYESVSECLKEKADKYENKFKKEADALW